MDVTPLVPAGRQVVESYGGHRFKIAGAVHDGSVLVFAALVSLGTGIILGLGPALRASRADVDLSLRGAAHPRPLVPRGRRPGPFAVLVVSEFALALVLLVGSGERLRTVADGAEPGDER